MRKEFVLIGMLMLMVSMLPVSVLAVDQKGIHILDMGSNIDVSSGDSTVIYLNLKNDMAVEQTINLECGIFADDIIKGWGLMALTYAPSPIDSCAYGEIFVSARSIKMLPNEENEMEITVLAPFPTSRLNDGTSNWGDSHTVLCGLYDECGGGYHTSNMQYGSPDAWQMQNINVRDIEVSPNTCGDGKIDQYENCGNCPEDAGCLLSQTCTYKAKTLFNPETYICVDGESEGCLTSGDCDDGNTATLDNCVGTLDRHCSYTCVDKTEKYNPVTGVCEETDKTTLQLLWEENQSLILGLTALVGFGFIGLLFLLVIVSIRRKD